MARVVLAFGAVALAYAVSRASAGHPPILLIDARGAARYLHAGVSWPLCAADVPRDAPGSLVLEPGATLILYSDGLVECRGEAIDVGLEELRQAAQRSRRLTVDDLCEALVGEMLDGRPIKDDVVVLAIRAVGTTAARLPRQESSASVM